MSPVEIEQLFELQNILSDCNVDAASVGDPVLLASLLDWKVGNATQAPAPAPKGKGGKPVETPDDNEF